jgi:hypothetical protein
MLMPQTNLARVLEEALVSHLNQERFVRMLNSYVDGSVRVDLVSIAPLSDILDTSELGVELALLEEHSGRREFFRLRIERGEVILPHVSAARTLALPA